MAEKRIPYEQALKLTGYMQVLVEMQRITQAMAQRVQELRLPLEGYAEIAGIPLTRADLEVHIDDGPDTEGQVLVEWKDEDAPT